MSLLNLAVALVALVGLALWLRERMVNRRGRALRDLLDGADALESQLQDYRRRMLSLRQSLTQLPSDMTAPAMASRVIGTVSTKLPCARMRRSRVWLPPSRNWMPVLPRR